MPRRDNTRLPLPAVDSLLFGLSHERGRASKRHDPIYNRLKTPFP